MGIGAPWYPDVDPSDLRRASQAYRDLGGAIDSASGSASPAMQRFLTVNRTDTLNTYQEAWTALADPSACPGGYLGQMANGCRQMATGLDEAAAGIDDLRTKIDGMVAGGAIVTVAAGLLTFGFGSAVAGAATAGAAATTVSIAISTFLTRVAIVAAFEFVGGYLTSLSLQALRQTIFEPGTPIDFDQSDALTFAGISAGTGGLLYGGPGAVRMLSNARYLNGLPTLSRIRVLGQFGETTTMVKLRGLGSDTIVSQRQIAAAGKRSTADILVDTPSAAVRALWPDAGQSWRLAVGEVKTSNSARTAAELLSGNQTAVLVPLATRGGTMSQRLATELGWGTRAIRPGEASAVIVFRVGWGDFIQMPVSLRALLKTNTISQIVNGAAGARNATRMTQFLRQVVVAVEPVK